MVSLANHGQIFSERFEVELLSVFEILARLHWQISNFIKKSKI